MNVAVKALLLSVAIFLLAWMAEHLLVPGIVPVAWADEPQPLAAVEIAFLLRSLQYVAAFAAAAVMLLAVGGYLKRTTFFSRFIKRG